MTSRRAVGNKPGIDAEAIRALSDLLTETGLTEIEIEHNGARIRVARAGALAASRPRQSWPRPLPPPRPPLRHRRAARRRRHLAHGGHGLYRRPSRASRLS